MFEFDQAQGVVGLGPQFDLVPAAPIVAEPEVCPLLLMGELRAGNSDPAAVLHR